LIPLLLALIGTPHFSAHSALQTSAGNIEHSTNATQDHSMHEGHQSHTSVVNRLEDPDNSPEKLLADKKESEFNHHLAGLFVVLAGVFMLAQGAFIHRWPSTKYIWPSTFLLSGLFVFVWSDTELWPFGNRQWLEALQNNREVLQHKTFAALLLGLGYIEWLRVKGKLNTAWSRLVFSLVAIGGSILLLFHRHEAGMHGQDHLELMARIQSQHVHYAVLGIGLGIAKAWAELTMRGQTLLARLWPLMMVALGILLMLYQE
jgi:hypothetical protein